MLCAFRRGSQSGRQSPFYPALWGQSLFVLQSEPGCALGSAPGCSSCTHSPARGFQRVVSARGVTGRSCAVGHGRAASDRCVPQLAETWGPAPHGVRFGSWNKTKGRSTGRPPFCSRGLGVPPPPCVPPAAWGMAVLGAVGSVRNWSLGRGNCPVSICSFGRHPQQPGSHRVCLPVQPVAPLSPLSPPGLAAAVSPGRRERIPRVPRVCE